MREIFLARNIGEKERKGDGEKEAKKKGHEQPWVVITPPSRKAPFNNSKYGFWKRDSAGPSGSELSVMMTSNSFL